MQKFDVQIALEGVRDARLKWSRANREFQTNMEMVLLRLLHEAAANYMSVEEVSRASKLSPKRVRNLMRVAGLNPRDGKQLLAKTAADALSTNANLLGIAPHEMNLMSPLAYLPMGSELRQALTDKTTSQVHDLDDEPVSRNDPERDAKGLGWDRAHTMLCKDIYPQCQHRNPWQRSRG